ncbi:4'-phosphopantetheinyl transferase superfamily protein [Streptomyces sp. 372A]
MIEELLSPRCETAESYGDTPVGELFPEEAAVIANAVAVRRHEFTTVRACAREALGRFGIAPAPLLPGPHGEPKWPAGFVGSMTHCAGYRAAAVARTSDIVTIGVDAEPNQPLPNEGVAGHVLRPEERRQLASLKAHSPQVSWDRLFFSAKESVYKAWFPLTRLWLDFQEATVTIHPGAGTFSARLLVPGPVVNGVRLPGFRGGWLARDGLLVTAVACAETASRAPVPAGGEGTSRAEPAA